MVLCAMLAAQTAVCAQISIPLPSGVPLTLSILPVLLCGALLGPKWGVICQLVYLGLGIVGAPVFAGMRGGIQVLSGPTGGYLIGYLFTALLVGLLLQAKPTHAMLPVAMLVGLLACYAFGTVWFMLYASKALMPALTLCVLPYLPLDLAKIAVASLVAARMGVLRFATPVS